MLRILIVESDQGMLLQPILTLDDLARALRALGLFPSTAYEGSVDLTMWATDFGVQEEPSPQVTLLLNPGEDAPTS